MYHASLFTTHRWFLGGTVAITEVKLNSSLLQPQFWLKSGIQYTSQVSKLRQEVGL